MSSGKKRPKKRTSPKSRRAGMKTIKGSQRTGGKKTIKGSQRTRTVTAVGTAAGTSTAKAVGASKLAPWLQPSEFKCECGGPLVEATLKDYDFSPFAGMDVRLATVPGLRCKKCKGETLLPSFINFMLIVLAMEIVKLPVRMPAPMAKYLRRFLGATQQELADRMDIVRETVAKWECGDAEISAQHDFILRTIAIASMEHTFGMKLPIQSLTAVRESRPQAMPEHFKHLVVDEYLKQARAAHAG